MSCFVCGFTDRRRYRLNSFAWKHDGIPLVSLWARCVECGRFQVVYQAWDRSLA